MFVLSARPLPHQPTYACQPTTRNVLNLTYLLNVLFATQTVPHMEAWIQDAVFQDQGQDCERRDQERNSSNNKSVTNSLKQNLTEVKPATSKTVRH